MFIVAITDSEWVQELKKIDSKPEKEINFWTPTPWKVKFDYGTDFFFFLKSPVRKICGKAKFIRYEEMIEKAAWAKYRRLNGVKGFNSFQSKLKKYRIKNSKIKHNKIGCIILNFVEFWPENEYVDLKEYGLELPNQVVKFKKFYLDDALSKLGFVVGNKI